MSDRLRRGVLALGLVMSCTGESSNSYAPCRTDSDCSSGLICFVEIPPPFCLKECGLDCDDCGCTSGVRCVVGEGCKTGELGDPCEYNDDCLSGNCSDYRAVCQVTIGSPCTADNCDICLTHQDGWSYCSRDCENGGKFVCNEDLCLGPVTPDEPDSGLPTCRPSCGGCPVDCVELSSGESFCDCGPEVPGCEVFAFPQVMGGFCRANIQCASGDCYNVVDCSVSGPCDGDLGRCSATCSSDGDCSEGHRCVGVSCGEDGLTQCAEQKCLPLCDDGEDCPGLPASPDSPIGTCTLRRPPQGADVMVCDIP